MQVLPGEPSQASLLVSIRVRPVLRSEAAKGRRDIIRVIDNRVVLVLDPDEQKVGGHAWPARCSARRAAWVRAAAARAAGASKA